MNRLRPLAFVPLCLLLGFALTQARAQAAPSTLPNAPTPHVETIKPTVQGLPLAILHDQAAVFTSPAHIHPHDLFILVPLAAATGAAIATDHTTLHDVVSLDPNFNQSNVNASNALVYGFIAAPAALFLRGHFAADERARQTGILGAEAVADAAIFEQAVKLVTWRERPTQDMGRGLFFQSSAGPNSSFPSSHSAVAWASAEVIASRYHSPWVRIAVYTLASGVSFTRILGQQHFPSDVLVGSAGGWMIGHYVARSHAHETLP